MSRVSNDSNPYKERNIIGTHVVAFYYTCQSLSQINKTNTYIA